MSLSSIKPLEPRDCRRVRKLLDDFLSGELTVETSREIILHLEICTACRQEERLRLHSRSALKDSWNAIEPPAQLKEKILSQLQGNRFNLGVLMRLAAGLVLAVLALTATWVLGPDETVLAVNHFAEAAHDHLACHGQSQPLSVRLPLDGMQAKLEQALSSTGGSYRLVDRRLCRVGDATFVHYLFEGKDGTVSLMLEQRVGREQLKMDGATSVGTIGGVQVAFLERDSVEVAAAETPHYFTYLVSSEAGGQEKARRLATSVLPTLEAAL